ncbi:ROK family protein [Romboutsia weinsteinii]|uniref:ROK family protein n=1 Tax=Romboutsia weinsteinii TaxID=2020949 RepID=A0A371J7U7_9FIRM|nr:ROK family protein [Romboutsia weinsteinii]RDY28795.1 ROK family protein [Romboutsia weinsteinii]
MYTIGIDVGGTSIKAGLVREGKIIYKCSKDTDRLGGADKLVEDIAYVVDEIMKSNEITKEEIKSIGVGIPGVVAKSGEVTCVNLGLKNELLSKKIQDKFENIKVVVENDATVAAVAEHEYGSMKGYDIGVMLTLGTGVGGGIIINGKPFSGAHGVGSELGHVMISSNYYDCNCGNNGCFETFCSATAIIKYAQKLISENRESIILGYAENNIKNITARMVFDAYREEDSVAGEVVNRFKKYLAMGIVSIIHSIDPEVISIGGGVSNASDIVLDGLSQMVNDNVIFNGAGIPDIVIAEFKNDAGILGASAL